MGDKQFVNAAGELVEYDFITYVMPETAEELPGDIVLHTIWREAVAVKIFHHDSALDTNTRENGGKWAIYGRPNHRIDYDPPEHNPLWSPK